MRQSFIRFAENLKCAEVGVGRGANALNMLESFPMAKFYLIDSYDVNNSTFQFGKILTLEERSTFINELKVKLEPFKDRAKLLILDSVEASKRFPDEYFDYVYIDAQHEYDSVLRDLRAWFPKVKGGGVLGGDDCDTDGVRRAINDFFVDGVLKIDRDWYLIK